MDRQIPLPCPDLPAFDDPHSLTLREACERMLVTDRRGIRLDAQVLQRWASRGCRIVRGGPLYLFPSVRGTRDRMTTPEWCAAWNRWVGKVRAEAVRREIAIHEAVRTAARSVP